MSSIVPVRPIVVCLCGSTRFSDAFRAANLSETLAGRIVLTIGCDFKSDDALGLTKEDKERMDILHLRKIDMADEVLILNVGDYLGDSTLREIRYARYFGKRVRFLEPHACPDGCPCQRPPEETLITRVVEGGQIPGVLAPPVAHERARRHDWSPPPPFVALLPTHPDAPDAPDALPGGFTWSRVLPDGRVLAVTPQLYGAALITLGPNDGLTYDDQWMYSAAAGGLARALQAASVWRPETGEAADAEPEGWIRTTYRAPAGRYRRRAPGGGPSSEWLAE